MLRSTSTVTLLSGSGSGAPSRRANVCRLRLTVPPENPVPEPSEKKVERREQHRDLSNGESTRKLPQGVVYGVVRRSDQNQQKEMVVYGWTTNQLKEEMNYIKDVRATLEKVRKRMYGDYDEMRQKIRQLTQELSVSQAKQDYLENHIQTQSSALDSFNAMNAALASDSISLQKTLVDVTLENSNIKDQIRNLQQTYTASMDKLREKQRQLDAAQVENKLLKMKEETNSFLKAIEEANKKMQAAEISLEEKDQRIGELDRLIERMEKERHQLQLQLLEHETEMSAEITDSNKERYQQLEEASASLRERIRHLDDMVHCQQKKVKQMVEEIESLKKKVQQKQLLILQLLEKISFLEGETVALIFHIQRTRNTFSEQQSLQDADSWRDTFLLYGIGLGGFKNNELQSRLDYLIETQSKTEVETREVGVGCDLLPSQTGRTREISMPSRNYTPYTRVLELTTKKTLT
uniref:Myocardial zonula adherens protein n=1 Tax=Bos indicus x Bos taurus TaxID=30522 RepID=A0A4W2GB53_BOBOX